MFLIDFFEFQMNFSIIIFHQIYEIDILQNLIVFIASRHKVEFLQIFTVYSSPPPHLSDDRSLTRFR